MAHEHTRLEFHDSEVGAWVWDGPQLRLCLAAAHVHGWVDAQGTAAQGYVRALELRLEEAQCHGDLPNALGRLQAASLVLGARRLLRLDLPCAFEEPLQLELECANGTAIRVVAQALRSRFSGPADFRESLAC